MVDTSGIVAGNAHEPSMEDILASIRRMIADDDVPAVNAADAASQVSENMTAKAEPLTPTSLVKSVEPAATITPPSAPMPIAAAPAAMDTDLVFENFETDFDFEDDLTIPDAPAVAAAVPAVAAAAVASKIATSSPAPVNLEDMDLIDIDELIAEVEARSGEEVSSAISQAAALDAPAAVSENTDIELVKSLMADLTEDDLAQDTTDADLDEILSEIADIERDDSLELEMDAGDVDEDFNALLKIAQEAKADASPAPLVAGLAVGAAGVTAAVTSASAENETPELDFHDNNNDDDIKETTHMADAVEETIIQGEVEEATVSAFASLASVVERKDEVISAGPGIGELVKEALQPMLKDWLDKNLKGIVERSVAKEIKRIANTK